METHKIVLKPIFFILFLVIVSFGCNKKNADDSLVTVKGKTYGKFLGKSNELFPLKIKNSWDYLIVKYDTLGNITDSNIFTIRIKNQLVFTNTKDTFYNFDGFFFKNLSNNTVLSLDSGYKTIERIKVGLSRISFLGSLAIFEEYPQNSYSYLKYEYYAETGIFTKYERTCYVTRCQVSNTKGDLIRIVEEYFQPGVGIVARDIWKRRNEYSATSPFYLESRIELYGYNLN